MIFGPLVSPALAETEALGVEVPGIQKQISETLPGDAPKKPVAKKSRTIPFLGPSPPQDLTFMEACRPGKRFLVTAVGDVLLHGALQRQAAARGYFEGLWHHFTSYFQRADISYANLEGPTAAGISRHGNKEVPDPGLVFDKRVYTSYPRFNYPPRLTIDLAKSGIDVVSTANNHALDRGAIGIDRTIEALKRVGLHYTGTRHSVYPRIPQPWHALVERNGLTTAWVSCTYGTNGVRDRLGQVLYCYRQTDEILQLIRTLRQKVDAVFVVPHWGVENNPNPNTKQKVFARKVLDSGAMAVIGTHPHTVQPMETYTTKDGRQTLIVYSLGNFVHGQPRITQRATVILLLGLTKTNQGTILNGVRFLPAYMTRKGYRTLEPLHLGKHRNHAGLAHILRILPRSHLLPFQEKVVTQQAHCRPHPSGKPTFRNTRSVLVAP